MIAVVIRIAENVMILALLAWMVFSDTSPRNYLRRYVVDHYRRLFVWLGLNGGWRMFSPNPPMRSIWPIVRFELPGEVVVWWEPEDFATMSVRRKIAQKKFHTYFHQVVRPGATPRVLRDFTEYLLRTSPHLDGCLTVEVFRVALPTPPYGADRAADPAPTRTSLFTFHPHPPVAP